MLVGQEDSSYATKYEKERPNLRRCADQGFGRLGSRLGETTETDTHNGHYRVHQAVLMIYMYISTVGDGVDIQEAVIPSTY